MIRLVQKSDIEELAKIYKDLYDNADIGENWTIEKAYDLLMYWYEKQKDLFFVDIEDNIPVGAIVSGIKAWFDGLRLVDTEIFVSDKCQKKHIGKSLMLAHLKEAKVKYNVSMIEFHTYGAEDEFPQNWYNRIGFEKDEELIIMHADVDNVLNKLGYSPQYEKCEIHEKISNNSLNYSYKDLSKLYVDLSKGDTAYIFDMLPEYAYLDNELEREYIESRITAMKNMAKVNLFIIGSKEKLNRLKNNKLFEYTINSCVNDSKIYIIREEEIKQKCMYEFFQLAQGLYYGERADGTKEAFRDLWINTDGIGIMIKDESILNHIQESVSAIIQKIYNGEIKIENVFKESENNGK